MPASRRIRRWWETVGCEMSKTSVRSQTQHSSPHASRFTIATRVGSASALNTVARSFASPASSAGASGPQQRDWRTGSVFIDEHQYSAYGLYRHPSMKGAAMSLDALPCCDGGECCSGDDCC